MQTTTHELRTPQSEKPTVLAFLAGVERRLQALHTALFGLAPIPHELIVHSMDDAVFVLDEQARITGYNTAGLRLMHIADMDAPVIGKPAREVFAHYLGAVGRTLNVEDTHGEVVIEQSGAQIIYEVRVRLIRDKRNHKSGSLIILRDITAHKLAEQRALELAVEREKRHVLSDFVRDTSHDLRTPLAVMTLSVYALRRLTDEAQRAQRLDALDDQIRLLTAIIEQLHQMVLLDDPDYVDLRPLRLNDTLHPLPPALATMIEHKHMQVDWSLSADLPLVGADPELLAAAFRHVLHNAILYTPDGGRITIQTGQDSDQRVYLEVKDTGIGIDAEHLPHIFERFYKVNTARTADGSGAGLGLSIVQKIMEAHHGAVTMTSTPGQGSACRLLFPVWNK